MNVTLESICLLLATSATAQTYVVAAGGGGQFTDLPAAVAAVPSGATLHVKAGAYSPFTVQGKSLTILAETVGTATIQNPVVVTGIGAAGYVHISGFVINGGSSIPLGPQLSIKACAGDVIIDRVSITSFASVAIDTCSDVHVLSCSMPAATAAVTASNVEIADSKIVGFAFFGPSVGLQATLGSVVTLTGSTVIGANAVDFMQRGADAVIVRGSTIHVSASLLQGGAGGPQEQRPGGNGGDGLSLASGSRGRVYGASLSGGAAGGLSMPGQPGLPLRVDGTSTAVQNATPGPLASLAGAVGPGLVVTASMRGRPAAPAALLLGSTGMFLQPYPLALGAWTVSPWLLADGLAVPPTGLLQVPITVPLGWPGDTVVLGQFLTFDAGLNEFQASNTFTAITR